MSNSENRNRVRDAIAKSSTLMCLVMALSFATLVVNILRAQGAQNSHEGQLIQTVKSGTGEQKNNAIEELGTLKSANSVETLKGVMKADQSVESRASTAIALGKIGDERGVNDLVNALKNDPSLTVRINAARALGMFNKPELGKYLVQETRPENPVEVRAECVRALGMSHTDEARSVIINAMKDSDPEIRLSAIDTLAKEHDNSVLQAVLPLAQDQDPRVAAQTVTMLGELRDKDAEKLLIENVTKNPVANVRAKSAFALGRIGSKEAQHVLKMALFDGKEQLEVKLASVEALGMIGGPEDFATLSQVLKGDDEALKAATAIIASQLRLANSGPAVRELARDADPHIRYSAIIAMGMWPSEYVTDLLKTVLDDKEDIENRITAITSLDGVSSEKMPQDTVAEIAKLLNPNVRLELQIATVQYLEGRRNQQVKNALQDFSKIPTLDPEVREVLDEALRHLNSVQ